MKQMRKLNYDRRTSTYRIIFLGDGEKDNNNDDENDADYKSSHGNDFLLCVA